MRFRNTIQHAHSSILKIDRNFNVRLFIRFARISLGRHAGAVKRKFDQEKHELMQLALSKLTQFPFLGLAKDLYVQSVVLIK